MSDAAAIAAWESYRRLRLHVDAEIARDLERASGLSMADYDVLAALSALSDGEHCIRVRGLTEHLHWAHSRLSRQLGRMERRGLVAREKCELDGRGEDVVLTEEGRRAHDRAAPAHLDAVRRHFTGALSPGQLAAFTAVARSLAP
ncbi:MarR family winged helix-turn-helix transcriptional regulator [Nonomuraea sp. NPDC050790]|uniref:MarR family winged helix-turn-helix transcriptional regulator n=1 Tax=Nonomuraea sp. NPDC050790 TaxID=3364371 RepID=UPI0037A6C26B